MAGENLWKIVLDDGKEYTLARSDITVGALRQFKAQFGPPYGKFLVFVQLLMEGDADAWCAAVWLCKKNAGEKPLKPMHLLDFAVGDVMLSGNEDEDEDTDDEADPTESTLTEQSEESPPEPAQGEIPTPA